MRFFASEIRARTAAGCMVVSWTRSSRMADFTALSWSEASQIAKRFGQAQGVAVLAQDPRAERVERADRDLAGPLTGEVRDALLHLAGRLVGEGDGEDARGVDPERR